MAGILTHPSKHEPTAPFGELSHEAPPPEPGEPTEDGGGGDWELLTVAGNHVIAYLIRGRLAEEGIDAVLDASNGSPGAWLHPFGDMSSPVKIFVRRADLSAASLLLHEVEQPSGPPPTGPGARAFSDRPRRAVFRVVVAVVAALALSGLLAFGPCVSHWFCI